MVKRFSRVNAFSHLKFEIHYFSKFTFNSIFMRNFFKLFKIDELPLVTINIPVELSRRGIERLPGFVQLGR